MNMILEKKDEPSDFRKTLINPCIRNVIKVNVVDIESLAWFLQDSARRNKNNQADSVVHEFLKYGGYEVKNKLLKIMNMILEKRDEPNDFRKKPN